MKKFKFYSQYDQMDCGPTCLRMIAKHYGKNFSLNKLREISGINREGVSLLGISDAAEKIGFRTLGIKIDLTQLSTVELPLIVHWNQNHFVVLYKIKNQKYYIADPGSGLIIFSRREFAKHWFGEHWKSNDRGIILSLSPSPAFFENEDDKNEGVSFRYLLGYLYQYKQLIGQLFLGLGVGTLLQFTIPFLTQSIVDIGISTKDINFIYVILIAQTMLFIGRISVEFLRSWILLQISSRINISILTDFFIKLMRLPINFFDARMTGDIMQRINDQHRIEAFLTGSTLSTIFSMFNLIIFAFILAYYNTNVFMIFLITSVLYSLWVVFFLKRRRSLDAKRFDISAKNQNSVIQLIGGMQEIKLNNCEQKKRWEWESLQAILFKFSLESLSLGQIQQAGFLIINEGKNIIITFLVAKAVIDNNLTLGGMMAIQYIVAQVNNPVEQLLAFVQQFQDAKISLERLNEIHHVPDEESIDQNVLKELPPDRNITFDNVSFTYPGAGNEAVLRDINMLIPHGKITAIVGMSGSGKTTILKLLLRFYKPQKGNIKIGSSYLDEVSHGYWREKCGTVMQEGFIFSDSILKNIAVADDYPDMVKLEHAVNIANIGDFIRSLPLGFNTKIGVGGNGISTGQKQRILIARAVYKNPEYIFFDEATNALDANNESLIMKNLNSFFQGRTVVIVAHRLSTVKHADNIVVLNKGKIVEQGNHNELTDLKGEYFDLVKNQLELGSS